MNGRNKGEGEMGREVGEELGGGAMYKGQGWKGTGGTGGKGSRA